MRNNLTLQIQAILYQNDVKGLKKSLMSLAHAFSIARQNGVLTSAVVKWGDASPEAIFDDDSFNAIKNDVARQYNDLDISLTYTFFNENTGYGKGHNKLFEGCTQDMLLILNPDIVVCHDFFINMLKPFDDKRTGLTEARQTPVEHPKYYNTKTFEAYWSSGACFIMPAPLFGELGGFDTDSFFMYSEDVDLSFRIRQKKLKLIYVPDAPVFHGKHFNRLDGLLTHTETELRFSEEAKLVLAYKWRANGYLKRTKMILSSGNEYQKAALASFEKRLKNGELKQISGDTSVFKERYLNNRFSM